MNKNLKRCFNNVILLTVMVVVLSYGDFSPSQETTVMACADHCACRYVEDDPLLIVMECNYVNTISAIPVMSSTEDMKSIAELWVFFRLFVYFSLNVFRALGQIGWSRCLCGGKGVYFYYRILWRWDVVKKLGWIGCWDLNFSMPVDAAVTLPTESTVGFGVTRRAQKRIACFI